MGRLHARAYAEMPEAHLEWVYDSDPSSSTAAAHDYGCKVADSVEQIVDKVAAVSIATPTIHHVETAEPFLRRGIACIVEKPLAPDSVAARRLVDLANKNNAPLMVGHIERFNPAVRALLDLKLKPQFIEVQRISPMTFRSIDVGVVLDMMIHDIDIVLTIAQSEVKSIDAVGVSVIGGGEDGDAEDICNARINFANGCVANLTASRLALKTERKLRVFSPDAYVSLDYQKKYGIVVRRGDNLEEIRTVVKKIRRGEIEDISEIDYAGLVDVQELTLSDEANGADPIRAELEAFIGAVMNHKPVPIPGEDGLSAVELAEKIISAIARRSL